MVAFLAVGALRRPSRTAALGAAVERVLVAAGVRCSGRLELPDDELAPALLRGDTEALAPLVDAVAASELLVVVSPVMKAGLAGGVKCFLDIIPPGRVEGRVGVAALVGGSRDHLLAVESAKVALTELGLRCPARRLYVTADQIDAASGRLDAAASRLVEEVLGECMGSHTRGGQDDGAA